MKSLSVREIALAAFAFVLGMLAPAVLRAADRNPFLVVDGDGWLTSNADFQSGKWSSLNSARPAFGLQLSERNDLPFDRGTAGATFWVHNADCAYAFETFGSPCGWQLGLAVTQFRSLVVGGQGMEIDGLGAPAPYARVVNSESNGARVAGLLTNAFVDFSGVDSPDSPSWFGGFDFNRDAFVVRRSEAGSRAFADVLSVDRAGNASIAGGMAASAALQSAPHQWATRAQLVGGRYAFRYAKAFAQTPVCIATPEGDVHLHVKPAPSECLVTSDNPKMSVTVDIVVVGNPS